MPERSTVAQVTQIGKETVAGTAVAATRRLGSLSISPSISAEAEMFRPEGAKFATVQALNREWATFEGEGQPTYEEVVIPLTGALDKPTIAQVMDGATPTAVYEWTFEPDTFAPDLPETFSLERGQVGVQVEKFTHMLFNQFAMELSRSGLSMSTGGFAKRASTGTTATGGLSTPTSLTPILPGQFSVYLSTTQAGLESSPGVSNAANRLTRVISANPSIGERFTPAWFINSTEDSFTTYVEGAEGIESSFAMVQEADAVGMALLDRLRDGGTVFMRMEALGPVLYNAGVKPNLRAMFQWDLALKVQNVEGWSDEDGIYAIPWTLTPIHDGTWGKAMRIVVRNKVASL